MTYQISQTEITFTKFTGKVASLAPKSGYDGWRSFARNEKTGAYVEVFGLSQEDGCYVQGQFEGYWIHHTHDTRKEAATLGWKAYRWLNR